VGGLILLSKAFMKKMDTPDQEAKESGHSALSYMKRI